MRSYGRCVSAFDSAMALSLIAAGMWLVKSLILCTVLRSVDCSHLGTACNMVSWARTSYELGLDGLWLLIGGGSLALHL